MICEVFSNNLSGVIGLVLGKEELPLAGIDGVLPATWWAAEVSGFVCSVHGYNVKVYTSVWYVIETQWILLELLYIYIYTYILKTLFSKIIQ